MPDRQPPAHVFAPSVEDLASFIRAYHRQPVAPGLQRRGGWSHPVGHLADDLEVLRRRLTRFFARYDAVLTSVAALPAVFHGEKTGSIAPTLTFSLGGQPAAVVPFGRSDDGMPIGVQIAAGIGRDHVALAVAASLERAGGGWRLPAGVPGP